MFAICAYCWCDFRIMYGFCKHFRYFSSFQNVEVNGEKSTEKKKKKKKKVKTESVEENGKLVKEETSESNSEPEKKKKKKKIKTEEVDA